VTAVTERKLCSLSDIRVLALPFAFQLVTDMRRNSQCTFYRVCLRPLPGVKKYVVALFLDDVVQLK
jgi:hypothetical protein